MQHQHHMLIFAALVVPSVIVEPRNVNLWGAATVSRSASQVTRLKACVPI